MEVMRGQSTHMELSLEGLATSVMGGLQDELFNLTLDNVQVCTSCMCKGHSGSCSSRGMHK